MSVTYLIVFTVRPEQRDRFLSLLNGVLDAMRDETTFVNAKLHSDPAYPNRFLLHETWAYHQVVIVVHIKRPYRDAWHAALPELLVNPRDISVWEPLRTDIR